MNASLVSKLLILLAVGGFVLTGMAYQDHKAGKDGFAAEFKEEEPIMGPKDEEAVHAQQYQQIWGSANANLNAFGPAARPEGPGVNRFIPDFELIILSVNLKDDSKSEAYFVYKTGDKRMVMHKPGQKFNDPDRRGLPITLMSVHSILDPGAEKPRRFVKLLVGTEHHEMYHRDDVRGGGPTTRLTAKDASTLYPDEGKMVGHNRWEIYDKFYNFLRKNADQEMAKIDVVEDEHGLYVGNIREDSVFKKFNVLKHDRLHAIDGKKIKTRADLLKIVSDYSKNKSEVEIKVKRAGKIVPLKFFRKGAAGKK